MKRMTFAQYAAHRGVSRAAVTYAVQNGRIKPHVDEKHDRFLLMEEADVQWEQNTDKDRGVPAQKKAKEQDIEASVPSPGDKKNIPPLYESKAIKEAFFARAAKLRYETDAGKLIPANEVAMRWAQIVSIARTKILGVPSKYRQRMPEMTNESYLLLEEIIRETLEDLADVET